MTSPGLGKRSTSCLEKTNFPSILTSNTPRLPLMSLASTLNRSRSSAAKLVARGL